MVQTYIIYADGACKNNGKTKAEAFGSFAVYKLPGRVMVDKDLHEKLREQKPLHHSSMFRVCVPKNTRPTNNIAEAHALCTSLIWAKEHEVFSKGNAVYICMDSRLILSQMLGIYKTKDLRLRMVYRKIYEMFDKVTTALGFKVESLIHLNWISGEVMKASIIGH